MAIAEQIVVAASAKEEITAFVKSGLHGVVSSFKKGTIDKACEQLFIANGKPCPIYCVERQGEVYLIRRDSLTK